MTLMIFSRLASNIALEKLFSIPRGTFTHARTSSEVNSSIPLANFNAAWHTSLVKLGKSLPTKRSMSAWRDSPSNNASCSVLIFPPSAHLKLRTLLQTAPRKSGESLADSNAAPQRLKPQSQMPFPARAST
jgi:hypothetical protein